jgi:hypothetical protein
MAHNKVAYLQGQSIFEPFRSEIGFAIPAVNRRLIIEGYFALQTGLDSTPKHVGTISPNSAEDVRIYLDKADVTPYYTRVLASRLDELDQDRLARQYLDAMNAFIDYADSMGTGYDGLTASLRKDADKLAKVRPISSLVSQIGNRNHGHKGHLHICNFLYAQITCPEVPLTRVIALYNKDHPAKPVLPSQIEQLTFSCGPSFRLDKASWSAKKIFAGGSISATVALELHDSLEDIVVDLQRQLLQLQDEVSDSLDSIKNSLSANGVIRRTVAQMSTAVEKTTLDVQVARRDLQSTQAQIATQGQTLDQIKNQVDQL